jgi:hypothetical protein
MVEAKGHVTRLYDDDSLLEGDELMLELMEEEQRKQEGEEEASRKDGRERVTRSKSKPIEKMPNFKVFNGDFLKE